MSGIIRLGQKSILLDVSLPETGAAGTRHGIVRVHHRARAIARGARDRTGMFRHVNRKRAPSFASFGFGARDYMPPHGSGGYGASGPRPCVLPVVHSTSSVVGMARCSGHRTCGDFPSGVERSASATPSMFGHEPEPSVPEHGASRYRSVFLPHGDESLRVVERAVVICRARWAPTPLDMWEIGPVPSSAPREITRFGRVADLVPERRRRVPWRRVFLYDVHGQAVAVPCPEYRAGVRDPAPTVVIVSPEAVEERLPLRCP